MGSGISAVCGSKRSVLITNSVRKLPTIHEDDVDSDIDVEADLDIDPSSGKLHPAESRDSGIGENDIPHGYPFHRQNGSGFLKSSTDSSPEKNNNNNTKSNDETNNARVSRPVSCRLGHRGHTGSRGNIDPLKHSPKTELSDSQIRRLVISARNQKNSCDVITDSSLGELSDDTLSLNSVSSMSPDRRTNTRPRNSRRRANRRNKKGGKTTKTITDIETSTDTDISDTDMLSIPDETGPFSRKDDTPQRRGWVRTEDFTDVIIATSVTPRVGAPTDMYRIVSGTYSDIDMNLAKKASERSISSIILTPMDGTMTPTNSECFDAQRDLYNHCDGDMGSMHENVDSAPVSLVTTHSYDHDHNVWRVRSQATFMQNLEDLVGTLVLAIERQWERDKCSAVDFEHVMKGIRYQLVSMAMANKCRLTSPRIEVKGEHNNIFSDDAWRVQIRLRTEDEEIIETSEKVLAQRLANIANKGKRLNREDISILLAEHLKTIEKLQKVQQAGKLNCHDGGDSPPTSRQTSRPRASECKRLLTKRSGSATKLRIVSDNQSENEATTTTLPPSEPQQRVSELPPIEKPKGGYSRKHKIKAIPVTRNDNPCSSNGPTARVTCPIPTPSPSPSNGFPQTTDSGHEHFRNVEEEDALLFTELIEAFRHLWDALTSQTVSHLLHEYRKREAVLILTVIEHARRQNRLKEQTSCDNNTDNAGLSQKMGQQHSVPDLTLQSEQGIRTLDEEFVRSFDENIASDDVTVDVFIEALTNHMKKTRLIRVQAFNLRDGSGDWNSNNQRSNSFTSNSNQSGALQSPVLKRQHSFTGPITRQGSFGSRQNSFLRSLQSSRQSSYCRTRSRGSTGSSFTYSTTSSGIHSDGSGGTPPKSALSRELSYGALTEFEDIEEQDEDCRTGRDNTQTCRLSSESLKPPSGRKSTNGSRATSGQLRERDRRRGQTQVHGLGLASVETPHMPLRKIEEDSLPKVEGMENKGMVRSRPDSGIAFSTSSASWSSSEPHKERDLEEPYYTTSCQEMREKVCKVLAEQHNDLKSLVAGVTKGLNSVYLKTQALYCWLSSQKLSMFEKGGGKKNSSPTDRLRQLNEKKTTYASIYMDMLKIAGIKCERVDGFVKSEDYLPGNTVQSSKFQHSWVAVAMDGHYRLVDPQYGAMGDKFVQEHYFATSPDELILSHFPKDKKWLLMNQPATIEGFEGTLKTWPAMFHFNIRPLNMKSVIRTYDGKLSITVLLQNVAVNPQLEYAGPGKEIDSDILEERIDHEIRDVDNAETYHVTLPQEGNYYFTVSAHVLEECIDVPVFQYRIEYVDELL